MSDRITLSGLRVFGRHGVFDHERADGQEFLVDVTAWMELDAAAASDDLADTLDYGVLAHRVADLVGGEPCRLIEAVAGRVAEDVLAFDPRLYAVEVTVHKPSAPIDLPFADVAVTARRHREATAPAVTAPAATAPAATAPDAVPPAAVPPAPDRPR